MDGAYIITDGLTMLNGYNVLNDKHESRMFVRLNEVVVDYACPQSHGPNTGGSRPNGCFTDGRGGAE